MKSFVLFNNKGGVGKTTLTFNLAHMAAENEIPTVLLDYDPQCNLTSVILDEDDLVDLWEKDTTAGRSVASCIDLVRRGKGDIHSPNLRQVVENLWLLPGDLALSQFEQPLAMAWGQVHSMANEQALHVATALVRLAETAAKRVNAELVFIDVGPSLGALNRAVLLAADAVIIPLAPDLFSLQGLKNVGPMLRTWQHDWRRVLERESSELPHHEAAAIGYIVQQHLARSDRPVAAYDRWAAQIPSTFSEYVLEKKPSSKKKLVVEKDPHCIGLLKHFASLVPLAQAARKPIFSLKRADGVAGGQIQAVARARKEISALLDKILVKVGLDSISI